MNNFIVFIIYFCVIVVYLNIGIWIVFIIHKIYKKKKTAQNIWSVVTGILIGMLLLILIMLQSNKINITLCEKYKEECVIINKQGLPETL